jgi:hypothetical protein
MEQEREEQLYRLQADLCQALADPTRLKLLVLLGERPVLATWVIRSKTSSLRRRTINITCL